MTDKELVAYELTAGKIVREFSDGNAIRDIGLQRAIASAISCAISQERHRVAGLISQLALDVIQ
jgi:hypothetical protein